MTDYGTPADLADLGDVDLTGLLNGMGLVWDSVAGMWEPGVVGGIALGDVDRLTDPVWGTTAVLSSDNIDQFLTGSRGRTVHLNTPGIHAFGNTADGDGEISLVHRIAGPVGVGEVVSGWQVTTAGGSLGAEYYGAFPQDCFGPGSPAVDMEDYLCVRLDTLGNLVRLSVGPYIAAENFPFGLPIREIWMNPATGGISSILNDGGFAPSYLTGVFGAPAMVNALAGGGAFTLPTDHGAGFLQSDGIGGTSWTALANYLSLADLSDVGTVAYDIGKVLVADGTDYDSAWLDRLYDAAGTNYLQAYYQAAWSGARNAMELKSSVQDMLLTTNGGLVNIQSPTHVLIENLGANPGFSVYGKASDYYAVWNHSYGQLLEWYRNPGAGSTISAINGLKFTVSDYLDTDAGSYSDAGVVGSVESFPGTGVTIDYVTGGSYQAKIREGCLGNVTYLTGQEGIAHSTADHAPTIPLATGVSGAIVLYLSNATFTTAMPFRSSASLSAGASIGTLQHYLVGAAGGAGAVTLQAGLAIPDLNMATTNYGIHIADFTDDTNDWGFYNLARNYFGEHTHILDAKNVILGTTTGTAFGTATNQKLAFYGSAPAVQATALTAQLTTITHTAPTPDYAIQDFVDVAGDGSQGFSFKDKHEANTVLSVIANLQTRVSEIETKFKAYGLLA